MIEAHYLYGVDYDDIEIVIHPQSIIHSMIETADSSVLAQVWGGGAVWPAACGALTVRARRRPGCRRLGVGVVQEPSAAVGLVTWQRPLPGGVFSHQTTLDDPPLPAP